MSLSTIRTTVAAAVASALDDLALDPPAVSVPYGSGLDMVDRPTSCTVLVAVLEPDVACPVARAGVDVYLLSPLVGDEVADELLEDMAEAALGALRALPRCTVRSTERLTYRDAWPAFRITTEVSL